MATTSSYSSSTFTLSSFPHHPSHQERSRPVMRNLFSSVKEKLSGSSADPKSTSAASQQARNSRNPFMSNTPAAAPASSSPRNTTSGTTPTRRPPPTEAPPAYTETPSVETGPVYHGDTSARSPSPSRFGVSATSLSNAEDPYEFLKMYHTIFVIDDSGSMAGRSWREVEEALRTLAPICTERDPEGIDVFFLNHKSSSPTLSSRGSAAGGYRGITDAAAVTRLFSAVRPCGGTPTGTRLYNILKPYLKLCVDMNDFDKVRPINIIVITDGAPSDDVESVLINSAEKLDKLEAPPSQVGVQFFQVGNEPDAAAALSYLDDQLAEHGIRDMVDTVSWTTSQGSTRNLSADGILKAVLGAVIKRLDRLPKNGGGRGNHQHLRP